MAGLPEVARIALIASRVARGWSTTDLSREIHSTRRFVTMIEAGERVPSGRTLELWLRAVDADTETRGLIEATNK